MTALPTLEFVLRNYKNFNARATRDALLAYWRHVEVGGKMFWAIAGAMSSAQLGITLAPAIRAGLIHGISATGANLEESLFRLVANHSYKDFPEYRYFTKQQDTQILNDRMRRVNASSSVLLAPSRRSNATRSFMLGCIHPARLRDRCRSWLQ